MIRKFAAYIAPRLLSQDFAYSFATALNPRAHKFSTIWNVSGKEA